MDKNGWKGDPVDVVRMPDDKLTSLDNTRIRAARESKTEVQAVEHAFDEPLTPEQAERFTHKDQVPSTWGEAAQIRINKQSGGFGKKNPMGSDELPKLSGKPSP